MHIDLGIFMKVLGIYKHLSTYELSVVDFNKKKLRQEALFSGLSLTDLEEKVSEFQKKGFLFRISPLDSHQILLKNLTIPLKNSAKVAKVLPFQLDSQIPYPISSASYHTIQKKMTGQTEVQAYLTETKSLKNHLELLPTEFVTALPKAIINVAKKIYQFDSFVALYLGKTLTTAVQVNEGMVSDFVSIEHDLYQKDAKNKLIQEIDRALFYFNKKIEIEKIVFLGEVDFVETLLPDLMQKGLENYSFYPVPKSNEEKKALQNAASLGSCLEFVQSENPVEFCQKGFLHKNLKRKMTKESLTLTTALTLFLSSVYFFGNSLLKIQEKQIENKLISFASHYSHQHKKAVEKLLSDDVDFFQKLALAKKTFGKSQKNFQIYLKPQLVSNVLGLLSEAIKILNIEAFGSLDIEIQDFATISEPEKKAKAFVKTTWKQNDKEVKNLTEYLENKGAQKIKQTKLSEGEYEITFFTKL